jgi:hypothetical protein
MEDDDSLQVDLGDHTDVRAKLPRARQIVLRKEIAADEAVKERDSWRARIELLAQIAGVDPAERLLERPATTEPVPESPSRGSDADVVVGVVEREARTISAADLREILRQEGYELSAEAVANALSYTTRQGRIQRVRRGFYAPLGYQEGSSSPPHVAIAWDPEATQVRRAVDPQEAFAGDGEP